MASLCWIRNPLYVPPRGTQDFTRVATPGVSRYAELPCTVNPGASEDSWVPHPNSAGALPSAQKPSQLQVFTNSCTRLGTRNIWVSLSAIWITLVPVASAKEAQPI